MNEHAHSGGANPDLAYRVMQEYFGEIPKSRCSAWMNLIFMSALALFAIFAVSALAYMSVPSIIRFITYLGTADIGYLLSQFAIGFWIIVGVGLVGVNMACGIMIAFTLISSLSTFPYLFFSPDGFAAKICRTYKNDNNYYGPTLPDRNRFLLIQKRYYRRYIEDDLHNMFHYLGWAGFFTSIFFVFSQYIVGDIVPPGYSPPSSVYFLIPALIFAIILIADRKFHQKVLLALSNDQ